MLTRCQATIILLVVAGCACVQGRGLEEGVTHQEIVAPEVPPRECDPKETTEVMRADGTWTGKMAVLCPDGTTLRTYWDPDYLEAIGIEAITIDDL